MANFRRVLHISRFSASSVAALALTAGVLAFGAGMANADPNDPAMTEVPPNGQLQSSGAARFSGGDRCVVNSGRAPPRWYVAEQGSPQPDHRKGRPRVGRVPRLAGRGQQPCVSLGRKLQSTERENWSCVRPSFT